MENATTFGFQAGDYRAARPSYPEELFDWIADQAPTRQMAWDVGSGSGQASLQLAARFSRVHATDIDSGQIAQAPSHPSIAFDCAPAHVSGLPEGSVDAITVATALHWFEHEKFWQEVRRVARKDAIFCAWTYHAATTDEDVQRLLIDAVKDILRPYWSDGNRLSWRGYAADELNMPFEVVPMPVFECRLSWTPMQIAGFVRSWSAHQKARLDGHAEALARIETAALARLGDAPRSYVMPLNTLAARIR